MNWEGRVGQVESSWVCRLRRKLAFYASSNSGILIGWQKQEPWKGCQNVLFSSTRCAGRQKFIGSFEGHNHHSLISKSQLAFYHNYRFLVGYANDYLELIILYVKYNSQFKAENSNTSRRLNHVFSARYIHLIGIQVKTYVRTCLSKGKNGKWFE